MREILTLLPKPSRYLGMEENAVPIEPQSLTLHCALAFPDMYEVGMSYLGQKIIYDQLNAMPGVGAERVFTPCREAAAIMREHKVKLATLESDTPLDQVHLIGFSLTHELAFTNVLYMLDLAGIPLRQADRGDDLSLPVVVIGGGCALCAEPLAPFADLMAVGEGEAMMPELAALLIKARAEGWSRADFLLEARHIGGIYVPSLFDDQGHPLRDDYPMVRRRVVEDLDKAPYPVSQIIPFGAVHNRLSLEIARGCTRGCRFCQAGMTYRPSRERSLEKLGETLDACLASTGYEEVSFLSLSSGDFSGLKTLFCDVHARCAAEQVALSLPSLRVGSVDGEIMGRMAEIRRTGATLAPEAGSQRLRDVINKGVSEEGLIWHVRQLAAYGWQQVKLYFMIGLPTETYEDLDAIVDLCLKVRDAARQDGGPRLLVTASLSPFVPKTHTPFQWDAQISLDEMKARVNHVRSAFRPHKSMQMRWHEPAVSYLEGILSRGDRALADVVEKAYRKDAIFCSWMEDFKLEPWLEALAECGLNPADYTGERALDAPLPWDHLEAGVSREFLLKERERALRGAITGDCRYEACRNCGACDTKAGASLLRGPGVTEEVITRLNFPARDQEDESPLPERRAYATGRATPPKMDPALGHKAARFRVWHHKEKEAAWLSQLDMQSLLERSLRRARLPLAFSQGFHPLPLLSFGKALPVGVASRAEWFVITLREWVSVQELQEKLGPRMLRGMELVRAEMLPVTGKAPQAVEEIFHLRCEELDGAALSEMWDSFTACESLPLTRLNKKNEEKTQDLRPLLREFELKDGELRFTLNWSEGYISPLIFVQTVFPAVRPENIRLTKLAQFF